MYFKPLLKPGRGQLNLIPEATAGQRVSIGQGSGHRPSETLVLGFTSLLILVPKVSSEEIFPSLPKWMSVLENLQEHMATNLIFMLDPFES